MTSFRTLAALTVLATGLLIAPAMAQQPPGGGGGRGGFGRGMQGMFGQRDVTLASAPIGALTSALKLSDEQKAQVEKIQEALRSQMQQEMQAMRQGFQGGGGGFDPQAMREMMQEFQKKAQAADGKASAEIEKVLTDDQKKIVPDKLAEWKTYQQAGLSIDLAETLKFTDDQKKALAEWVKKNPRPQFPGGFGGPGGGRRGGGGNGAPPSR